MKHIIFSEQRKAWLEERNKQIVLCVEGIVDGEEVIVTMLPSFLEEETRLLMGESNED